MTSIFYTRFSGSIHTRWEKPDFLSATEHARLPDGRFAKRRADWLLGRWTAKHLLRLLDPACAVLPLTAISIENEPGGAPFILINGQPYPACLSTSHSHASALAALSLDLTIGADLERIEPRSSTFIEDYLTPTEAATVRSLPDSSRAARVTLLWSAKEAVFKVLRIGLRADTRTVEIIQVSSPGTDGWGTLKLHTSLSGAENLRGWWREEDGFMLTLAARCGDHAAIDLNRVEELTLD